MQRMTLYVHGFDLQALWQESMRLQALVCSHHYKKSIPVFFIRQLFEREPLLGSADFLEDRSGVGQGSPKNHPFQVHATPMRKLRISPAHGFVPRNLDCFLGVATFVKNIPSPRVNGSTVMDSLVSFQCDALLADPVMVWVDLCDVEG